MQSQRVKITVELEALVSTTLDVRQEDGNEIRLSPEGCKFEILNVFAACRSLAIPLGITATPELRHVTPDETQNDKGVHWTVLSFSAPGQLTRKLTIGLH